ncbi:MAG: CAAX prenyl protease-related protein [Chthoniobacterales bacterium]
MDSAGIATEKRALLAHVLPMGLFLALLALVSGLKQLGGSFWLSAPEYWVFPLQTIGCAALLIWFRQNYEFRRLARPAFTLGIGLGVYLLWIAPQAFLHFAPRTAGFDPNTFGAQPVAYAATVAFRFLRLVIVVPIVEEIFWRGFLLRYFIDERFTRVAFGTFSWLSFAVVTVGFTLAHSLEDWPAAVATGMLYNLVAYRTKSLTSCIVAHALTNLLLGFWIMRTGEWGFW